MSKVQSFLFWTLRARIDPLAYLTAYASLAIGFFFVFLSDLPDVQDSILFKNSVLGSTGIWGLALLVGSIAIICGMAKKSRGCVRVGAMINFIMWLFACLLYASNEYWYAFWTFGLVHIFAQGYFYLVASIDSLWQERYT